MSVNKQILNVFKLIQMFYANIQNGELINCECGTVVYFNMFIIRHISFF